jgi:hypothetical protein
MTPEQYLKENKKLANFERAVVLNDLQSIYSIMEDFADSEVSKKQVVGSEEWKQDLHDKTKEIKKYRKQGYLSAFINTNFDVLYWLD